MIGNTLKHPSSSVASFASRQNCSNPAELRLDQCFDTGALQRPAPSLSRPLGRGSLFASELDRLEQFWHGANDGTVLEPRREVRVAPATIGKKRKTALKISLGPLVVSL